MVHRPSRNWWHDGSRVYTIIHWASEADFRHFEAVSDTEGRMAVIQQALAGLSGKAEPRMSGNPRYVVVHEVGPGPHVGDAGRASPSER